MSSGPGLLARHPVCLGDLVRLLEAEGLSTELAARLTGFMPDTTPALPKGTSVVADPSPAKQQPAEPRPEPAPAAGEIWRVARHEWFPEALAGDNDPALPAVLTRVKPLENEQLKARSFDPPRVPPLAPWRRLAPALRRLLCREVASSRLDERRLVSRVARLQLLHRVPPKTRRCWTPRLQVVWDQAEILDGFSDDQQSVIRWLLRWHGPVGLDIVPIKGSEGPGLPSPGATVLALTDLGCLEPDESRQDWWTAYGHRLRTQEVRAVALALAPAARLLARVERAWLAAPWEQIKPHGRGAAVPVRHDPDEAVERLLNLLSVSARIDTAVLRAMRRLIPGADLGVESDLRRHADVVYSSSQGIVLDPEKLADRRMAFAAEPEQLREQVAAVLRRCHRDLPPCLLHEELLLTGTKAEQEAALVFFARLARRIDKDGVNEQGFFIGPYVATWQSRRNKTCWTHDELAAFWALAHRTDDGEGFDQVPPEGLHPNRIAWALHRQEQVSWWRLRQRGDSIVVSIVSTPDVSLKAGDGFLLGHLPTRTGLITVNTSESGMSALLSLTSGQATWTLPAAGSVVLESDGGVLELQATTRPAWVGGIERRSGSNAAWLSIEGLGTIPWPSWAQRLEHDDFGVAAELELARGVVMRFRWIPPGRFLMGSPFNETGRSDDEGPQHEVELTRGFWLAETMCTQRQWQAVQRSNPSHFEGLDRPVENLSWDNCQEYVALLNDRFPDLRLRLPTEAEWEYACRAGTTRAFSDGSTCTQPTGKDPALEALGWYRKNSDRETHPVKQKQGNGWGLFDMHGNVWEWCADWWQDDYKDAATIDPIGPADGQARVIRGGSYWNNARDCRSAYRYWRQPGERNSDQGFRPLAGQLVSKGPPEGAEQGREEASPSGKEGGTTDGRWARLRRRIFGSQEEA